MDRFHCNQDHGPHHGTYDCYAHMSRERWRYGKLIAWSVFEWTVEED